MAHSKSITVSAMVAGSKQKIWDSWTQPGHITRWNFASDDWECPSAENDVRPGGKFNVRMQAKDGSAGFDFGGVYSKVKPLELIEYEMNDGRKVKIEFIEQPGSVKVVETFDLESENSEELQRSGWQAILENFKKYVEFTPTPND